MKRTFDQMDVDTPSTTTSRRPAFKRQRRMVIGRPPRRPALSRTQRMEVQRLVQRNTELKYFAFNAIALSPISNAMNLASAPFQIPQGVSDSNRIGDQLTWTGVKIRFEITNSLGALADQFNNMRLVILQWKPNSIPVNTDVFLTGPTGAVDIYSTYNHDRRTEFIILHDETFRTVGNINTANSVGTCCTTTGVLERNISVRYAQKNAHFAGGGLTAANMLYIALVSDSAAVPHPTITYQMKTFFRDA